MFVNFIYLFSSYSVITFNAQKKKIYSNWHKLTLNEYSGSFCVLQCITISKNFDNLIFTTFG